MVGVRLSSRLVLWYARYRSPVSAAVFLPVEHHLVAPNQLPLSSSSLSASGLVALTRDHFQRESSMQCEPWWRFTIDRRLGRLAESSSLVILAPGSTPPPGVKITEHSTIMGVFWMVTSPAATALVMSVCEVSARAWRPGFHETSLICHNGE